MKKASACRCWLLFVLILTAGFPAAPTAKEKETETETYTLGIVPSLPPVDIHKQWTPFVERLSRDAGFVFRLKLYEKMSDFEKDIVAPSGPDFIFADALQVVVAHEEQGYAPLVRGSAPVRAVLFVRKDSPLQTVDELSEKRIAFVGEKNL